MWINWQTKMIQVLGVFFLFCLYASFFVNTAGAATFCVSDSSGLQNALIVAASNGEDDTVQVVQGSYVGNFVYSSSESYDVTIEGGYTGTCASQAIDPANTILDGDKASSVLVLASSEMSNFTVQGLSLQNGDASSGGEGDKGAGLYVKTAVGNVSVSNCAITGNTANGYAGRGGGVYVSSPTVTMTNNTITGNTANGYHGRGGGVCVYNSDTVTMTNNTITGNTAKSHGGVYVDNSDTVTMTNNTITGNTTNGYAGGVCVEDSDTVTMTNNTITGNTANSYGGVYVDNSDTVTMTNNTITGNTTEYNGGGVYVSSPTVTMTNNTITGNTANGYAGGVYVYSNSSSIQHVVTMTNNTITGNSADNGGGLYLKLQQETGYTYIYNNIIWSNIAITQGADIYIDNDGDNDHFGSPVDIYNNDFDQSATGFYIEIPIIIDSSNLDNQDPLFKDIYCHLTTGSPCIDAGENNAPGLPLSDMDGDNRIINGIVDIGADECFEISVGSVAINNVWKSVNLSYACANPIVITSPPTYHGADPGVVRLRNVTNNSFDVRFQEWLYKDGGHTLENISYLVLFSGRHQMLDGSIWEAGTFSLSGTGAWTSQAFTDTLPSTPALFLTAQTYNGGHPITVRARNVTNTGFEAALFEEENKMDGHVTEEVGYLAVYSPQLSGTVDINGTDVPYLLQAQSVDHRFGLS